MSLKLRKSVLFFVGLSFVLFAILLALFPEQDKDLTEEIGEAPSRKLAIQKTASYQNTSSNELLNAYDLRAQSAISVKLPGNLREISGLALTSDGKLLAHDDEEGTIYQLNYLTGEIIDYFIFTLNGKIVRDDLEGIAVADHQVYVTNSSGKIYKFSVGAKGKAGSCEAFPTPLAAHWEIEGLTYNAELRCLVFISKKPISPRVQGKIGVFFWSVETQRLLEEKTILIPFKHFASKIGKKKFKPSGIEWDRSSGNYLVVASKQHALAEIDANGSVLAVERLRASWHRQMEGITFLDGKGVLISDEGDKQAARLTLYPLK